MIIELRKAGFVNKGAALMLHAMVARLRSAWPDARLVAAPGAHGSAAQFRALGLDRKAWAWRWAVQWGDAAALVPAALRRRTGLVLDRELDAVIDAAGFAYAENFGPRSCVELLRAVRRWQRRGTRIVLMPQAFGPFRSPANITAMREVLGRVDRLYVRDATSLGHLEALDGPMTAVRRAPDFTCLLAGEPSPCFDPERHGVAIIPNVRMLDQTSAVDQAAYLPWLINCARALVARDARPFLLVHEGEADRQLAEQVAGALQPALPVVVEPDPLRLKGLIGECHAVVGSRYHGLVSALSQAVPALAVGWSHKYAALYEDYEFPAGLVTLDSTGEALEAALDRILLPEPAAVLRKQLVIAAARQRVAVEAMWVDVFAVLRGDREPPEPGRG